MSADKRILQEALEAHNEIDKRIWTAAGGGPSKKPDVLIGIASAHIEAAVKIAHFSGMSQPQVAEWLYAIADTYATQEQVP